MVKYLIVLDKVHESEDMVNRLVGWFAGRLGMDTEVCQVRRLEENEHVKVVEK